MYTTNADTTTSESVKYLTGKCSISDMIAVCLTESNKSILQVLVAVDETELIQSQ